MKKQKILLCSSLVLLTGCISSGTNFPKLAFPESWSGQKRDNLENQDPKRLEKWWTAFNDPILNALIEKTLKESPDRKIAKARILEGRGLLRTARSFQFPQIGFSGNQNRQDFGFAGPGNFFEATFDASYEIDVFGRVRNSINASQASLQSLEAQYHNVTLTLIADVSRSYINYRAAQKQSAIAQKNLDIQSETLKLIKQQYNFGEAPKLDVERAETLVNTTRASIPEFNRLADNYRLQLSILTGSLPADLLPLVAQKSKISNKSIEPILLSPASVLSARPDIRAASSNLSANSSLTKAAIAEIFPTFNIQGFFGYSKAAFSGTEMIWNIAIGTAATLIDFGRLEGAVDVARAREIQSFELLRKTVLNAVTEVETALSDTGHINEQRIALLDAYKSAERSLGFSNTLYKEGEISFLDVLDAQRVVNEAQSALISAETAYQESYIRLYKSLGVY